MRTSSVGRIWLFLMRELCWAAGGRARSGESSIRSRSAETPPRNGLSRAGGHGYSAHGGLTLRLRLVNAGSERNAGPRCPLWALWRPLSPKRKPRRVTRQEALGAARLRLGLQWIASPTVKEQRPVQATSEVSDDGQRSLF